MFTLLTEKTTGVPGTVQVHHYIGAMKSKYEVKGEITPYVRFQFVAHHKFPLLISTGDLPEHMLKQAVTIADVNVTPPSLPPGFLIRVAR